MNKVKLFIANKFFGDMFPATTLKDAGKTSVGGRELASAAVKRIGYKSGDSDDFEEPDFSLEDIQNGYNTDSYIRQGVDKYVDQVFKEGYTLYGKDSNIVDYIKLRLEYMAEATGVPIGQFLTEIVEDFVKFGNTVIVKARAKDPTALPQGTTIQGLGGKDPVAAYFLLDPKTMTAKRDKNGTVKAWKQESDSGEEKTFRPEDIVHFYYKKARGSAYGTSFLVPVLDDVRALRQAEENVLKMMYRNIYPFYHFQVGTKEVTGSTGEVDDVKESIGEMDVDGGLVTTERVNVKPIASDQVIDAAPYLKYLEERVFSGMGIPGIMFGRGNTANRSTGDNMTSEMSDRIRAITRTIEMLFNEGIIKELLMEGGYDPVLNPAQKVELKFYDNDIDMKVKKENHAIFKYEHNAITEPEMRLELGLDPIEEADRKMLHSNLVSNSTSNSENTKEASKEETNNKVTPTNKKKAKDNTLSKESANLIGLISDEISEFRENKESQSLQFFCSNIIDIVDGVITEKEKRESIKIGVKNQVQVFSEHLLKARDNQISSKEKACIFDLLHSGIEECIKKNENLLN